MDSTISSLLQLPDVNRLNFNINKLSFNSSTATATATRNDSSSINLKDTSQTNLSKETNKTYALHQSILDGRLKQINYFLKMGAKVNSKDKYGRTCLMLACLSDHEDYGLQVAKLLIKYGADLNIRDTMFGQSVIYFACTHKRERFFNYLIDNNAAGIDLRIADNDGNILLNHVAAHGSTKMLRKIIEKMIERNIEIDQRNSTGYTALLLAIRNEKYLNAYVLVKEAHSSLSIKDKEKFYNALEWLLYKIDENKIQVFKDSSTNKSSPKSSLSPSLVEGTDSLNTFSSLKSSNLLPKTTTTATANSHQHQTYTKRKSLTNLSLTQLNYKSWYTESQYFNDDNQCVHSCNFGYSTDPDRSTYIPFILTPRNNTKRLIELAVNSQNNNNSNNSSSSSTTNVQNQPQQKQQKQQLESTAHKLSENYLINNSKENSFDSVVNENTDLIELIKELYKMIYRKMSESYRLAKLSSNENNQIIEKSNSTNHLDEKKTKIERNRSHSNAALTFHNNKASLHRNSKVNLDITIKKDESTLLSSQFIDNQQTNEQTQLIDNITNIINSESMRQTPKLLALQPKYRQSSVKDAVHSILSLYDSSLIISREFSSNSKRALLEQMPRFDKNRSKSIISLKEKSNLSDKSTKSISKINHNNSNGAPIANTTTNTTTTTLTTNAANNNNINSRVKFNMQ